MGDEVSEKVFLLTAAAVIAFICREIAVFRQRGRAAVAINPAPSRQNQQQKQAASEKEPGERCSSQKPTCSYG